MFNFNRHYYVPGRTFKSTLENSNICFHKHISGFEQVFVCILLLGEIQGRDQSMWVVYNLYIHSLICKQIIGKSKEVLQTSLVSFLKANRDIAENFEGCDIRHFPKFHALEHFPSAVQSYGRYNNVLPMILLTHCRKTFNIGYVNRGKFAQDLKKTVRGQQQTPQRLAGVYLSKYSEIWILWKNSESGARGMSFQAYWELERKKTIRIW